MPAYSRFSVSFCGISELKESVSLPGERTDGLSLFQILHDSIILPPSLFPFTSSLLSEN